MTHSHSNTKHLLTDRTVNAERYSCMDRMEGRAKVRIFFIIMCHSISMRAGLASLQFDWLKAGLSMDLPVFLYSHTKTSLNFLSSQGRCRAAFYVVTDLLTSNHRERTLQGSCFVQTSVCQDLPIIKIVICIHYLIVSSPLAVRPTTLSLSVNTVDL